MTMFNHIHITATIRSELIVLVLLTVTSSLSLNDDGFGLGSLFCGAFSPPSPSSRHPLRRHLLDGLSRYDVADSAFGKISEGFVGPLRPAQLFCETTAPCDGDDNSLDSTSWLDPGGTTDNNGTIEGDIDIGDISDGPPSDSVADIQRWLVEKGGSWKQSSLSDVPNMTRVPGCIATVYVLATMEQSDDGTRRRDRVTLHGNSDAMVSRGLLCLLRDYLKPFSRRQVLELDPKAIADALGVRPALSTGRNDGLSNMLTIIQDQLLREEQQWQSQHSEADITPTMSTGRGDLSRRQGNDHPPSLLRPETIQGLDSAGANQKPTVALLLSGGVDSSVALRLLLKDGYHVVPFYLKIWLEDELAHLGHCPWEDDVITCRAVCEQAGVHLEIISLQEEYHQRVMQHTLNEAALGRTPNPDILCNSRVKFGCFLDYLEALPIHRFDYIASGHYARIERTKRERDLTPVARLFRAPDPVKDQSYFLCALGQTQLQRLLFPIGHMEKTDVRKLADEFNLPNRHRPDSQGLCFLGKVKFRDFMQIHLGEDPGDIVDAFTGEVIGRHHGVWYHTVGQRKGIGPYLKPQSTAFGPWYVVAKDPLKNVVYASNQYDEDVFAQARSQFHVEDLHWIAGRPPTDLIDEDGRYRLTMKIRHGPKLASGTLKITEEGKEEDDDVDTGGIVELDSKDGGLAPGQFVVFYTPDAECLGGGIISERHWAKFLLGTQSRVAEKAPS